MVPEADQMSLLEIRVDVQSTIMNLALHLKHDRKIWGGGASVRGCRPFGVKQGYALEAVTEEGYDFVQDFDLGDEVGAVWAFLQRIGGAGTVNVEEDVPWKAE